MQNSMYSQEGPQYSRNWYKLLKTYVNTRNRSIWKSPKQDLQLGKKVIKLTKLSEWEIEGKKSVKKPRYWKNLNMKI